MSGVHKYPTISFRISPRERDEIEAAPQVGRPMVLQVMFLGAQQSPLIRSPERQRCAQSSPADACR